MNYNLNFSSDYKYGKKNELYVFDIVTKFWKNRNISLSDDMYSNFDFYDDKYKYELKSRRCSMSDYPTTMIPVMKCHKHTYLLFLFTDGLYYIKYKKKVFKNFEKKYFALKRNDKIDVNKEYYYIPIELLKKIYISTIDETISS